MSGTGEQAYTPGRVAIPLVDRLALAAIGLLMCSISLAAIQLSARLEIENPDDYTVVRFDSLGRAAEERHATAMDMLQKKYGSFAVGVASVIWFGWTVLAVGLVYSVLAPNRTERSLAYAYSRRLPWRSRQTGRPA